MSPELLALIEEMRRVTASLNAAANDLHEINAAMGPRQPEA